MYPAKYIRIVFALYCIYFHLKLKLFFAPLLNNLKKKKKYCIPILCQTLYYVLGMQRVRNKFFFLYL